MLKNKSAIVTGSTSGIGLGIARALAKQGANVMLNGFGDPAAIADLAATLAAAHGVKVLYSAADMTRPDQIEAMVRDAEAAFGAVDVLVNNAGIQHTARVEDFPADKWEQIMAINLSSNFYTIRAALPGMQRRGWGRIVNIASVHGQVASSNKAAYVAAKHGVIGLTKTVALENARSGITCNAICPGWVLTPLVQKQIDDLAAREGVPVEAAQARLLGEKQPSQAFATPEQIAAAVLFLCSDGAQQMRGAALTIDGGWTAQ
jgi:3-hydroxybutyrate dehydrogenase